MPLDGRLIIPVLTLVGMAFVLEFSAPALSDEWGPEGQPPSEFQDGRDNDDIAKSNQVFNSPANRIEWFGMNLGGGYAAYADVWGKAELTFVTISRKHWYYTILEWGVFVCLGTSGFGGRIGWQKFISPSMAIRVGLKPGMSFWDETVFETLYSNHREIRQKDGCHHYGVELTPHAQFVWFFEHGTVGVGIDVLILFGVGYYNPDDFNVFEETHDVAAGVRVQTRGVRRIVTYSLT